MSEATQEALKGQTKKRSVLAAQDELEKELRERYVGKRIVLVGEQLMWDSGGNNGLSLSKMSSVNKGAHTAEVGSAISFNALRSIHIAVNQGVLALEANLSKKDRDLLTDIVEQDVNSTQFVEEMEDIDNLLHSDFATFRKNLASIEQNKRVGKEFYTRLLEEEKKGKNRKDFLEEVKTRIE